MTSAIEEVNLEDGVHDFRVLISIEMEANHVALAQSAMHLKQNEQQRESVKVTL